MAQGKKEEAEELKKKVQENAERVEALSKEEKEVEAKIKQNMMIIPNIIDPSVPIGKDDSETKFHIIQILWKALMESTLKVPEK